MLKMRYAVHLDFDWNRDLLLHLLRGSSRPLRNYLDPRIGDIRVGFHRKILEGDDARGEQENGHAQNNEAGIESAVDQSSESLLLHRVLELQRVSNHLLTRRNARNELLHAAGKHVSADHFDPPKLLALHWHVDPIAIMQVQRSQWPAQPPGFPFADRGRLP